MDILVFLMDGLLIGFVYGIAAMGLTLIWGVMNVINLSHGSIIALGMFGVYLLLGWLGLILTWGSWWSPSSAWSPA